MSPHTRRRLLQSLVGLTGALAGCPGGTDGNGTGSPLPAEESRRRTNSVVAPEHRTLRDAADRPVVWVAENADGQSGTPDRPDQRAYGEVEG